MNGQPEFSDSEFDSFCANASHEKVKTATAKTRIFDIAAISVRSSGLNQLADYSTVVNGWDRTTGVVGKADVRGDSQHLEYGVM